MFFTPNTENILQGILFSQKTVTKASGYPKALKNCEEIGNKKTVTVTVEKEQIVTSKAALTAEGNKVTGVTSKNNNISQYYLDFFNERAGILEVDSNHEDLRWLMERPEEYKDMYLDQRDYSLREACEYKAFDYTIAEWMRKENTESIETAITTLLSYGLPKVRGLA